MCLGFPRHVLFLAHPPSRRFLASNFQQAYSEGFSKVTCTFNANLRDVVRKEKTKQKRRKIEGRTKEAFTKNNPFDRPVSIEMGMPFKIIPDKEQT
jgi:hypothetical protein